MKHRIYKLTLIILILGICLFLISHFRLNNSFGTYVLDYDLVHASESKNTEEYSLLNNNVTKQTIHIFTIENIKILILAILLPGGSWYFFAFTKKGKNILKYIKKYFDNKLITHGIIDAREGGNKELSAKTLLENALASASSNIPEKKLTGIQQLCQFTEDKALFGLISMLASEKDISFVYCIITALNVIIKKRAKKNEI